MYQPTIKKGVTMKTRRFTTSAAMASLTLAGVLILLGAWGQGPVTAR
jgi:hypothetical protein